MRSLIPGAAIRAPSFSNVAVGRFGVPVAGEEGLARDGKGDVVAHVGEEGVGGGLSEEREDRADVGVCEAEGGGHHVGGWCYCDGGGESQTREREVCEIESHRYEWVSE